MKLVNNKKVNFLKPIPQGRFKLVILILFSITLHGQLPISVNQSKNIGLPDIPGYKTLKCDFHTHTVFSDGNVWPTVRVDEAYLEGLDAIAITDHIEYLPHKEDVKVDYNRSYNIALPRAKEKGVLLVRAAEITRSMPPGHFNVLFIKDPNVLQKEKAVEDVLKEAKEQGAFILWNHPGWKPMAPNGIRWYKEHSWLLENGLMDGIEVYNNLTYYPEAVDWAIEKNLAIFCDTDIHEPISMNFDLNNSHRPITLVFAKDKTILSLREALLNKRSAAYFDNKVVGPEEFLKQLFHASIEIKKNLLGTADNVLSFEIKNISDIDFELDVAHSPPADIKIPESIVVYAHHTAVVEISYNSGKNIKGDDLKFDYKINNFYISSSKNLIVTLNFN